jgi:hypothetical protein
MAIADLTPARLREVLHCDPNLGLFTWIKDKWKTKAGQRAGYGSLSNGYRSIRIDYVLYAEHRLAFLYMDGKFPEEFVDHINGVKNDNRWSNLRHASPKINAQNVRVAGSHNVSGWLGVGSQKGTGKFTAQVSVGRRTIYLGTFETAQEAQDAYFEAKRKLHEGCTL